MTPSTRDPRIPQPDGQPDEEIERGLASVSRPAARAEFRESLRRDFLSAARGASTIPLVDVVEDPPVKRSSRRPSWMVGAGLLAAAAVVALLVYFKPSDSRWKVVDGTLPGLVYVDGVAIRAEDRERLERSLVEAHEIHSDNRLRLRFGDWYLLELAPETRVSLSPIEQRARPEPLALHLEGGSLRMRTGPAMHGEEMRVTTSDANLKIKGTNFAVDMVPDGTCFCCLNGTLTVALPKSQQTASVKDKCTYHVYRDGHAPKEGPINPDHVEPLNVLEEIALQLWH